MNTSHDICAALAITAVLITGACTEGTADDAPAPPSTDGSTSVTVGGGGTEGLGSSDDQASTTTTGDVGGSSDAAESSGSVDDANLDDGAGTSTGNGEVSDVPLLLWSMHGGRFMRSCDTGLSWSALSEQDAEADCFHDPDSLYSPAAYGAGRFVAPSGWGDPGAIYSSVDALTWSRLDSTEIEGLGRSGVSGGGVFFDGSRFVVLRRLVSPDGVAWTEDEFDYRPPGVGNVRRVRVSYEEGLVVVAGNNQEVFVSDDWGLSWTDPASAAAVCPEAIQHRGDIAFVGDRIVMGQGSLCSSTDAGVTWVAGPDLGAGIADLFPVPSGLVAFLNDERVVFSADGVTWEDSGVLAIPSNAGSWAGQGDAIVAVGGFEQDQEEPRVVRSDDGGATWTTITTVPRGPSCSRSNLEIYWVPAEVCESR